MKRQILCVVALLVAVGSCRGCREQGPADIFELAPANSLGVIHVRDLRAATRALDQFLGHATHKAGAGAVKRVREAVTKQFGFDPLNGSAYDEVGLRADAGALLFIDGIEKNQLPVLALGVADRDKFDRTLRGLITRIDGADRFTQTTLHERTVTTAGRPFGNTVAPAFAWAYVGDWVLVVPARFMPGLDNALLRMHPHPAQGAAKNVTLNEDKDFIATRKHLAPGLVYATARMVGDKAPLLATSWTFGNDGFSGDTQLSLAGKQSATPKDNHDSLLPLAAHVAPDAVMVFLSRAATVDTWDTFVKAFDPNGQIDTSKVSGLRLQSDILPNLAGPLTLGVNVADPNSLSGKLRAMGGPQAALDMLQVAVTAQLTDPNSMAAVLVREQANMKARGALIRARTATVVGAPKGQDKVTVYEPDVAEPKLGWTIFRDQYVYGAGTGALDAALQRLATGDTGLAPKLDRGVVSDLAGVKDGLLIVRGAQMAAVLDASRQGDNSNLGLGAVVAAVAEVLRTLDDVALGFDIDAGGLRLRAREQLQ